MRMKKKLLLQMMMLMKKMMNMLAQLNEESVNLAGIIQSNFEELWL